MCNLLVRWTLKTSACRRPTGEERELLFTHIWLGWIQSIYAHSTLSRRLGREGEGFKIAMGALDGARLSIGCCSVGAAQACFEIALNYVKVLLFLLFTYTTVANTLLSLFLIVLCELRCRSASSSKGASRTSRRRSSSWRIWRARSCPPDSCSGNYFCFLFSFILFCLVFLVLARLHTISPSPSAFLLCINFYMLPCIYLSTQTSCRAVGPGPPRCLGPVRPRQEIGYWPG